MTRGCRTERARWIPRLLPVADKRIWQRAGLVPAHVGALRARADSAARIGCAQRPLGYTSANARKHRKLRQVLATPLLALTLAACAGSPAAPGAAAAGPPQWHCDGDGNGDGNKAWNCVESTAINADAARTRVRSARPPMTYAAAAPGTAAAAPDAATDTRAAVAASELLPEPTDVTPDSAASTAAPAADATLPDEPRMRRIGDLPPEYWSIQIIAVAKREQLEAFAAEHDLFRHPAARIESKGSLRYILLWDFYATRAEAAAALATLPPTIKALGPWLRSVGSLQEALQRAASLDPSPPAAAAGS